MLPNFTIMQGKGNIFVHNKQQICKIKWSIFVNAIQVKVTLWVSVNAIQVKVTLWVPPYVPLNIHSHFIQYWEMIPISSFRV